jgi:hypothetical protein
MERLFKIINGLKYLESTRIFSVVCLRISDWSQFNITHVSIRMIRSRRAEQQLFSIFFYVRSFTGKNGVLVYFMLVQFQHSSLLNTDTYHHAQRY